MGPNERQLADPGKQHPMPIQTLQEVSPNVKLTWELLVEMEPRLAALHEKAKSICTQGKSFCANEVWHEEFCDAIDALAGVWAVGGVDPLLRIREAYSLARFVIFNSLPDCRGCRCCAFNEYIQGVLASRREGSRQ
jgi:hypothetical protein